MGWRSVAEQVQQRSNLSPRLTSNEDTWAATNAARREYQRVRRTIEALSASRGATAGLLERTGFGGARSEDRVWQVLTETEINLERHVLKPLHAWVHDFNNVQALAAALEKTRIEVDWRARQLTRISADLDKRSNYQTGPRSQQGLPKLTSRHEKKTTNLQAARERHASQKQQLDTALAGLQGDAQKVPGTVAAAFWLHSDAFKAAATALDNQQQAVLVPTPPPGSPKQSVGSSAQPTGSHHFPTAKVPLPYAAPGPSNLGSRNGSTLNSGVNSPRSSHPASRTGSGIPSDEEDAPPTRPPHITSIYEQAKARQQQVQQAQARDADPPVSNAAAQARPITAVDITQGYGVYDNLRQPREYEPDTKPRTRVNSMASHGPTLYEVPSEVSSYDGAPTYDAEPKMARTITPKLDRPAVQEHHRSSDYDQEVPQYRRVSGPTAPPISDWKGFHAAQSGYPVALNAEPAFFSPLQHGQMQRPRTTRDVP